MTPELSDRQTCPICQAEILPDANSGLCPRCLLSAALPPGDAASGSTVLSQGTRLGPYQIGDRLGRGGMGEVYRAMDIRLGREVAVKVLPEHLASDRELRERFEREARIVSNLNHPHICTLYDVGEQDGIHYLVMELIEGETLEERLLRRELPLEEALRCSIQIADALEAAHESGIVHRDLKPGNVMLAKSGVKLLDFGLAKLKRPRDEPPGVSPISDTGRSETVFAPSSGQVSRGDPPGSTFSQIPTESFELTGAGTILGTLQYMAPEQLAGKAVDARTDVFAFGSVVYEMVTGRKAFEGDGRASMIGAIMNSDPRPMVESKPKVQPELENIVLTCLAKNPADRWQKVREIGRELRRLDTGLASPKDAGRLFDKRLLALVGIILVLAAQVIRAHIEGDPWIVGYSVSTLLVSAFFSLVIASSHGTDQKHFALGVFLIVAFLVTGAVWWRYIDLQQFLVDPENLRRPLGFCFGHYGFMPYLSVLGGWILFTTYMTHRHTEGEDDRRNRWPILAGFGVLVLYLLGARLVWETVDSRGLDRLRQYPSIELNCSPAQADGSIRLPASGDAV